MASQNNQPQAAQRHQQPMNTPTPFRPASQRPVMANGAFNRPPPHAITQSPQVPPLNNNHNRPPSPFVPQQRPIPRPGFIQNGPVYQQQPQSIPPPQQQFRPGPMIRPALQQNHQPIENQIENMQLGSSQSDKPATGRSRRVYAPMPYTNAPNQQQQQQQQPFNSQQPLQQQPANNQQPQQQSFNNQQPQEQPRVVNTPLGLPPRSTAKPRIDPNQIPSPVQIQLKDEGQFHQPNYYYGTCSNDHTLLPLASTHFRTIDQGNSNPRFIRCTLNTVPYHSDIVRDTGLPFGIVLQPFAPLHPDDASLPIVPLLPAAEGGPTRCTRCKGYLNPWCRYIDAGRKFICNLCDFENTVPEHQYCPIDMNGRRMDAEQHPETTFGSVEFDVSQEYWADTTLEPAPLHYLFVVDVSRNAVQSGMLTSFCHALKQMIESDGFPRGTKVGIITFDSVVHFYNLEQHTGQSNSGPTMMVVSDINDMFVPLSRGLFVDPQVSSVTMEKLFDQLPTLYESNNNPAPPGSTAVFGSAVQSALLALKTVGGGKVIVMQSSLPIEGPGGALKNRDDPTLYGCEREKSLFVPQNSFYTQLGVQCAQAGVNIDVWLFPPANSYIDVATLGVLSALTGGDTHYFPNYNPARQQVQFVHDLVHSVTREQGYGSALRLRCSNGVTLNDQFGNFHMSNSTDIELAGVNADTSVGIELKHDGGKLTENSKVYFQCAVLYTTCQGQRRVRVHNLCLDVGINANAIFKQADLDTSMNFLIKKNISLSSKKSLNDLSNELDALCVKILTGYRRYCASGASAAQLILPESFKMLPLLTSSLKKSAVLRKDPSLNVDTRVYNMRRMKNSSIPGTIRWLYPRMIKLHTLLSPTGPETESEEQSPPLIERVSYDRLDSSGIYWIQSHDNIFLWIGKTAPSYLIQGIFGTTVDLTQISPHDICQLPVLEHSTINCQLRELYHKLTDNEPYLPQLNIIRHGIDLEVELTKVLAEDEGFNQMSYVDYLCMIHKQIQTELEREKQDSAISAASYWAYRY